MGKLIKWYLIMSVVMIMLGFIPALHHLRVDPSIGVPVVATLVLIILGAIIKEQWRRRREGYFVYLRGGAEAGSVTYNEGGKLLDLYFDRLKRIVYVPSDAKWKSVMPDWAKARKVEIMKRIKKHIKGWRYEESDINSFSSIT